MSSSSCRNRIVYALEVRAAENTCASSSTAARCDLLALLLAGTAHLLAGTVLVEDCFRASCELSCSDTDAWGDEGWVCRSAAASLAQSWASIRSSAFCKNVEVHHSNGMVVNSLWLCVCVCICVQVHVCVCMCVCVCVCVCVTEPATVTTLCPTSTPAAAATTTTAKAHTVRRSMVSPLTFRVALACCCMERGECACSECGTWSDRLGLCSVPTLPLPTTTKTHTDAPSPLLVQPKAQPTLSGQSFGTVSLESGTKELGFARALTRRATTEPGTEQISRERERERERERGAQTHTDRHRHTQTDTHRHTQTHTDTHTTHTHTHTHTHRF